MLSMKYLHAISWILYITQYRHLSIICYNLNKYIVCSLFLCNKVTLFGFLIKFWLMKLTNDLLSAFVNCIQFITEMKSPPHWVDGCSLVWLVYFKFTKHSIKGSWNPRFWTSDLKLAEKKKFGGQNMRRSYCMLIRARSVLPQKRGIPSGGHLGLTVGEPQLLGAHNHWNCFQSTLINLKCFYFYMYTGRLSNPHCIIK